MTAARCGRQGVGVQGQDLALPLSVLLAVEDNISAVEFGFSGMLQKPYEKEVLLQKVAALIPVKVAA